MVDVSWINGLVNALANNDSLQIDNCEGLDVCEH